MCAIVAADRMDKLPDVTTSVAQEIDLLRLDDRLERHVQPHEGVPTLEQLDIDVVDLNELDDLAGTLELLSELGIL